MTKQDAETTMSIEEVANDVLSQLDSQAIDQIRHHPSSTDMHFGLGLWIRNEYIHSGKMGLVGIPDSVSSEITELIASKALPEYADYPLAVSLFDWPRSAYVSAHRYYLDRNLSKMVSAIRAHYDSLKEAEERFEAVKKSIDWSSEDHDEIWEATWDERGAARDSFMDSVLSDLFNETTIDGIRKDGDEMVASRLDDLLKLKGYSLEDENVRPSFFVPDEIAYLADSNYKGTSKWEEGKDALLWLLDEIGFYPDEDLLPSWLFDDDEIALEALRINGNLIQFMGDRCSNKDFAIEALESAWPSYKYIDKDIRDDRDVVKAAFKCENCGSLLFEDFFRKYNDDDELVTLALGSSGENLSWSSERIRNDFDMVCLAIDNAHYMDNIYEDISEDLRSDRRIVTKIASKPTVPMDFPPLEYKDDDEIGEMLADTDLHGDHYSLIGMSKRIKEKYMTEEELSRWGDAGEYEV